MVPAGQPIPGGPPYGGGYTPPQAQYAQQGAPQAQAQYAQQGPPQGGFPQPQYAPPPLQAQPPSAAPFAAPVAGIAGGGDPNAELRAEVAQLKNDVQSIALFARTLLALLEEKQLCTQEQFQAVKLKLDMMDGKVDDK